MNSPKILEKIYEQLMVSFGPQKWWPADSKFEVIIGAILTQNTNWKNVEKAIRQLKTHRALSPMALKKITPNKLAKLIRPAGYFNVKARRLKNFIEFLFESYGGDSERMEKQDANKLRQELLSINGIGPETADSILLYAFNKAVFVVDAYTKRILYRHNIVPAKAVYTQLQDIFHGSLDRDAKTFNEYHALIVHVGKNFCRPKAKCEGCPLNKINYSLVNKCSLCHRSLLSHEKSKAAAQRLCTHCSAA